MLSLLWAASSVTTEVQDVPKTETTMYECSETSIEYETNESKVVLNLIIVINSNNVVFLTQNYKIAGSQTKI